MITEEMRKEAENFGSFIQSEIQRQKVQAPTVKNILHPALSEDQMNADLRFSTRSFQDPRHPRNFYDDTKISSADRGFINLSGPIQTTFQYRERYKDHQDPSSQWQVELASGTAYKNMIDTHKEEWQKADWSQQPYLKLQHKLEQSFFKVKEAEFNFKHDSSRAMPESQFNALKKELHKDYREYKADQLGISPNQKVTVPVEPEIKQVRSAPSLAKEAPAIGKEVKQQASPINAMPNAMERLEAMRKQYKIEAPKQKQARSL